MDTSLAGTCQTWDGMMASCLLLFPVRLVPVSGNRWWRFDGGPVDRSRFDAARDETADLFLRLSREHSSLPERVGLARQEKDVAARAMVADWDQSLEKVVAEAVAQYLAVDADRLEAEKSELTRPVLDRLAEVHELAARTMKDALDKVEGFYGRHGGVLADLNNLILEAERVSKSGDLLLPRIVEAEKVVRREGVQVPGFDALAREAKASVSGLETVNVDASTARQVIVEAGKAEGLVAECEEYAGRLLEQKRAVLSAAGSYGTRLRSFESKKASLEQAMSALRRNHKQQGWDDLADSDTAFQDHVGEADRAHNLMCWLIQAPMVDVEQAHRMLVDSRAAADAADRVCAAVEERLKFLADAEADPDALVVSVEREMVDAARFLRQKPVAVQQRFAFTVNSLNKRVDALKVQSGRVPASRLVDDVNRVSKDIKMMVSTIRKS